MAGYNGYSKSNNAVHAENEGRYPLTIAAKILSSYFGVSQKKVKEFLKEKGTSEYHHTSKFYNVTYYYDVNEIIEAQEKNDKLTKILGENYLEIIKAARIADAEQHEPEKCRAYLEKYPGYSLVVFANDSRVEEKLEISGINWLSAENHRKYFV
jgi:hypothetical protein